MASRSNLALVLLAALPIGYGAASLDVLPTAQADLCCTSDMFCWGTLCPGNPGCGAYCNFMTPCDTGMAGVCRG